MGSYGGPNISRDGLILYLDAANTKSFRGEPTINLLPDPIDMTQWGAKNVTVDSTPSTYHIIDGQKIPFYKVTSTSNDDPYHTDSNNVGPISGKTFTFSIWAYTDEGQSTFAQVFQYGSSPFNSSTVSAVTYTLTTEPQKLVVTNNYQTDVTNTILQTRIDLQQGGSTGYIYVGAAQLEEKAHPTKFVDGTRGTTVSTGGGWADLSKKGNHGELVSAPTFDEINKGSLVFDGVDDYITAVDTNYPSSISDPFSIECWIYVPSSAVWTNGSQGNIIQRGAYFGVHGIVRSTTNNSIRAYFRGQTSGSNSSSGNIQRDKWHHCVATWSGSIGSLYIDGSLSNSDSTSITGGFQTDLWRVSEARPSAGSVGNWFEGKISLINIYSKSLTPEEILQNYNATKSRFGL